MTAADIPGADEHARPVDPRSIDVWRCTVILASVAIVAAALIAATAVTAAGAPFAAALWIASPLALLLPALVAWWYPPARYRHLRYRLDDTGILIQDGIFWRTQSALPHVRIQHTDVAQGPLQRRYGVATLKLYTAGSRFTLIELPGLEYAAAEALRDLLLRRGGGDAV